MKIKRISVTVKQPSGQQHDSCIVYDEVQVGVSDLHVITRDGFLTVNHLASDGSRRGHSWPSDRVLEFKTTL